MERIERLRLQLEEAEKKEAEKAQKKAAAEADRREKKISSLQAKLDRFAVQKEKLDELIDAAQTELAELLDEQSEEAFTALPLEVVTDDDDSDAVAS